MTVDLAIEIAIACAWGILAGGIFFGLGLLLRRPKRPAPTPDAEPLPEVPEWMAAQRRQSQADAAASFIEALGKRGGSANRRP